VHPIHRSLRPCRLGKQWAKIKGEEGTFSEMGIGEQEGEAKEGAKWKWKSGG